MNTDEAAIITDAIMNIMGVLKVMGALLIGFMNAVLTGFSIALLIVGVMLRKSNQITDKLIISKNVLSRKDIHIIKEETLRRE